MAANQTVLPTPAAPTESTYKGDSKSGRGIGIGWLAAIFALAAALRLWFNFGTNHPDIAFSCDAAEYLRNAQTLSSLGKLPQVFWWQASTCLLGMASPETVMQVRGAFRDFGDFFISGPVFPLYLLSSYALWGSPCEISNWVPPVAVQSIVTSFTCVLVALIGTICWDRKTGITAGLIAAVYPAFILNSGRLYSESFACFLLCLTIWLTVRSFTASGGTFWSLLLTGSAALALQLTRSVMFIYTLALFPITYFQNRGKRPWLATLILLAGCAIVALPWLGMQNLAFGKGGLVVDRVGHYNFFTGNNVDAQGWLCYPYPDMTGIEKKSFLQLSKESFKRSPTRWLRLMLDKPARLFKFPWNDFRNAIGPWTEQGQVFTHQAIILLAALGLALSFLAQPGTVPLTGQLAARIFVAGLFLFQCVYLVFITVPRYNLTLMPIVILFAAAGTIALLRVGTRIRALAVGLVALLAIQKVNLLPFLMAMVGAQHATTALAIDVAIKSAVLACLFICLWRTLPQLSGNIKASRAIAIVLLVAAFPSLCLPLRAHGRWYEWQCPLVAPGQSITQSIDIPADRSALLQNRQCYLLIDSDGAAPLNNGVSIEIDNHRVAPMVVPQLPFLQDVTHLANHGQNNLYLECEYIFECLTYAAGISNLDLRQWFLVPVPAEILKNHPSGQPLEVKITKTSNSSTTIFGAYDTNNNFMEIPDPALYSWEKPFYGVENDRGFTDTRYDTKLACTNRSNSAQADLSPAPGLQSGRYFIRLLASPQAPDKQSPFLEKLTQKAAASVAQTMVCGKPVSFKVSSLPSYSKSDYWLVRLSGKVSAPQGQIHATIRAAAHSKDAAGTTYSYDTPWAPRNLAATGDKATFDLAFPLVPSAMPGTLSEIDITILPPAQSGSSAGGAQQLQFSDINIEIDRMPSLPMGNGHCIF